MAKVLGPDFVALQVRASPEGAGVPILQQPQVGPFGRTFVFRDPDGYALTVHRGAQ